MLERRPDPAVLAEPLDPLEEAIAFAIQRAIARRRAEQDQRRATMRVVTAREEKP